MDRHEHEEIPNGLLFCWKDVGVYLPPALRQVYVLASNGLFSIYRLVVEKTVLLEVCQRLGPGADLEELGDFEGEGVVFHAPRIPRAELLQVEAFFRAVYQKHRAEAVVFLYFSPHDGGIWRFVAPEQEVTAGGLKWTSPGPPPAGWYLAGSFHSHGSMGAFHSGTDDHDELGWDGVHVTIGKINLPHPEYAASLVIGGSRVKIDIEDIVEPAKPVEFPSSWLERVKKPKPVVVATARGRGKRKCARGQPTGWYGGWRYGGGYDED